MLPVLFKGLSASQQPNKKLIHDVCVWYTNVAAAVECTLKYHQAAARARREQISSGLPVALR